MALGLAPVTVCSDLLKPGGYGRLSGMLRRLADEMRAAGCADLASWRGRGPRPAASPRPRPPTPRAWPPPTARRPTPRPRCARR
ncbi:MAG: hypothetical protein IPI34_13585 [bacterium]|nr:hypothetical protein [bacterium]